jgi:four helix bundle protein
MSIGDIGEINMNQRAAVPTVERNAGDAAQFWLWEKSFELSVAVFKVADRIPQELGLSLGSQMRLTALAIPAHLSLTRARGYSREFARGLSIVVTALAEIRVQVALCCDLGYSDEMEQRRLLLRIRELELAASRLLGRLRGLLSGNRLQLISDEIAAIISGEQEGAAGAGS